MGIEKVKDVKRPGAGSSPGPPPLDDADRVRQEAQRVATAAAEAPPRSSGESSGSGLAPHVRGKPLPQPSPDSAEGSAGRCPRHHGPPLEQPRLVCQVAHVDTSNIIVCIDWHDTLDQALNPVGYVDSRIVEKFRNLVRLAENRIEFHIVSYAGWSKLESTKAAARHLIDFLVQNGLPFREIHFARHPCGREGKSSILAALPAHCLVDDCQDILNENYLTGVKVVKSEGRWDRDLSWIALLDDWIRQEGIDCILQRRRPQPLKPNQFYPPHGEPPKDEVLKQQTTSPEHLRTHFPKIPIVLCAT